MDREDAEPELQPVPPAPAPTDHGGAAVVLLGAASVVLVVLVLTLFMGLFARDGDEPMRAGEVDEGQLSDGAYEDVELGTPEAVLSGLRPVVPVCSRVIDRYDLRAQGTVVAAECVYDDREDGRPGQQYRFCFADDLLADQTVMFFGDPGEGSAVGQEDA